jgi:putative YphP/YqiW family bacilliredoxin
MYPKQLIQPMKQELTAIGFEDLRTAEDVTVAFHSRGTVLVVVNSVCECAASAARPGVQRSLETIKRPNKITTIFAGFDTEATAQARKHFLPFPPSSPCIGYLKMEN